MIKKILLVNWDCYPHCASGGVYSWTKSMIDNMQDWQFIVVNQLSNPNCNGNYKIPPQVTKVIEIPIFGSNRYEEYHREKKSLIVKIMRTHNKVIEREFIPLYKEFIQVVLTAYTEPHELCEIIVKMHRFLVKHDTKKCFENHLCWQVFLKRILVDPLYCHMTLKEALLAFQLIQRSMQLLSLDIPKVDLIHCSLAWIPAFIAIFAKIEHGCPVIITEHGVAYRELLLYYNAYMYDEGSKVFWKVFSRNIVKTIYSIADSITPVCSANANWEQMLHADRSKIKVIYNGVDTDRFKPLPVQKTSTHPTIVCVARIEAFKDIICLVQAIKYVKESIPDVRCLIYGGSTDLRYSIRCVEAVKNFNLEETIKFMGATKEPERAYNDADVVVVSSVTEGFPFAIIEAMACGKAVVAADVGGVREALQGCGILVRSRHPQEFAESIIKLLGDKNLRDEFGALAVRRVLNEFTLKHSVDQFREQYESLIAQSQNSEIGVSQ
ncbi:GT4 family glycosyltransferase PelF [Candidatus Nitrosotenuis cloacae]|jgi:glycosyltransferase involved in cell wall biosynthesis|uniref:GT4 family glycosyltransferase PelF n=1 Tax=Candidatus Nitrosotenuis cloacae TaxID=1603555 RepID=UPI002281B1A4|nr:GT4 family glycosyltransferase PelF [Candidatus Nitrosotenuis cloacae]